MFPKYPYIVAEAGINHNGSMRAALEMIQRAKEAGADAVKFQKYVTDEFTTPDDPLYETFKRCEFSDGVWLVLKKAADRAGIDFFAAAQNPSDLVFLLTLDVPYVKIGSDEFRNLPLLAEMAKICCKPLILSCGMSSEYDIFMTLRVLNNYLYDGSDIAIMACTSLYPCMLQFANVSRVVTLRKALPLTIEVGYSDHTAGSLAAQLALAQGAVVFEKHFTLSHDMEGPDHEFSVTPSELRQYIEDINRAKEALGSGQFELSPAEQRMREYVLGRRKNLGNAEAARELP